MKEDALVFGRDRSLIGVMSANRTLNGSSKENLTGVLLLTAGLDHHVGPNCLWVKLARRLASMGFVALRFGYSGTGDSGPRRDKLPADKAVIDEAQQAIECLERLRGVKRFIVIGLCTGAERAFQLAIADSRVKGAILINPQPPETEHSRRLRDLHWYLRYALFNPASWKRFFLLRVDYRGIWRAVVSKITGLVWPKLLQSNELPDVAENLTKSIQIIQDRGVQLLILSSDIEEFGELYLQEVAQSHYESMMNAGLLSSGKIPGSDRSVGPLASQEVVINLISQWMAEKALVKP